MHHQQRREESRDSEAHSHSRDHRKHREDARLALLERLARELWLLRHLDLVPCHEHCQDHDRLHFSESGSGRTRGVVSKATCGQARRWAYRLPMHACGPSEGLGKTWQELGSRKIEGYAPLLKSINASLGRSPGERSGLKV